MHMLMTKSIKEVQAEVMLSLATHLDEPHFQAKRTALETRTSSTSAGASTEVQVGPAQFRRGLPPHSSCHDHRAIVNLTVGWDYNLGKCIDASPLVILGVLINGAKKDVVVIGSHSHNVACIDLHSGGRLWSTDLPDRIESSAVATR